MQFDYEINSVIDFSKKNWKELLKEALISTLIDFFDLKANG